jgi:DNA-binding transcriptional LysR family regulator
MNWDDLRIIAAVSDEGSYARASARLRIDETTVGRRLQRIERALGFRLFDSVDGQRKPTRQCEAVLAHVRAMAGHVAEISRVGTGDVGLTGRFRIASTHAVAEEILSPRVARLLAHHPGLAVQFLTATENVKFSHWQADLAVRLRKPEKGDFTISKLGEFSLYLIEPEESGEAPIVCAYPDDLGPIPESRFLTSKGLQERARRITDNIRVIKSLIKTHHAVGVLPEYFCQDLISDRRFVASLLPQKRDVWLLVQNHLRRDPAARIVIEWVREAFAQFARR